MMLRVPAPSFSYILVSKFSDAWRWLIYDGQNWFDRKMVRLANHLRVTDPVAGLWWLRLACRAWSPYRNSWSAMRCDAMWCDAMRWGAMWYEAMQLRENPWLSMRCDATMRKKTWLMTILMQILTVLQHYCATARTEDIHHWKEHNL